ncbi:MAG: MBL fold metallo-hydrolase [Chloroflexota bacterium]
MPARCRLPLLLLLTAVVLICLSHQVVIPLVLPPSPLASPTAPDVTASARPMEPTPMDAPAQPVVLTIVYDNHTQDARLRAAWGFACLVEAPSATVLFDTGGDGPTLLYNMASLGIDPAAIEIVVLSHQHKDHTGGLEALLGTRPDLMVYVPRSFAAEIERQVGGRATVIAVSEAVELADGVWSLGEMGTAIVEQSLAVETRQGLAVITGCAHPGIFQIAQAARGQGSIALLLGGFHLSQTPLPQIDEIVSSLQALGVQQVGPAHCTGEPAIERLRQAFGDGFVEVGVGTQIVLDR